MRPLISATTTTEVQAPAARARWPLAALLGLATCSILALQLWGFHDLRHDDAFITYRYGQNIATGNGPVFNPGEKVLGTTSPGQMLISALVYRAFGLELTPHIMAALGCVAWMAQAFAVMALLGAALGTRVAAALALAFALGLAGSQRWVALETNEVMALTLWSFALAAAGRWSSAAALSGLACVMRPDAVLGAAVLLPPAVLALRGRVLRPVLIWLVIAAPFYAFAAVYYGSPLPQSALTKFQRVDLLTYFVHELEHPPNALLHSRDVPVATFAGWLLAIAGAILLTRRRRFLAVIWVYGLLHLGAYLVLRPFVQHTWHLYPSAAAFAICAVGGLCALARQGRLIGLAGAVAAILITVASTVRMLDFARTHPVRPWWGGRNTAYMQVVAWLDEHARPRDRFTAVEVGTIAYYSGRSARDLGGLVTTDESEHTAEPARWAVLDRLYLYKARGLPWSYAVESGGFRVWVFDLERRR